MIGERHTLYRGKLFATVGIILGTDADMRTDGADRTRTDGDSRADGDRRTFDGPKC